MSVVTSFHMFCLNIIIGRCEVAAAGCTFLIKGSLHLLFLQTGLCFALECKDDLFTMALFTVFFLMYFAMEDCTVEQKKMSLFTTEEQMAEGFGCTSKLGRNMQYSHTFPF